MMVVRWQCHRLILYVVAPPPKGRALIARRD
jgi:hypothetical protein